MVGLGLSLQQNRQDASSTAQWWTDGASMAFDFTTNSAMLNGSAVNVTDLISCTRATIGTAKDSAGNDVSFDINELRITDKGLYCYEAVTGTSADDIDFIDISWFNSGLGTFVVEWEQIVAGVGTQTIVGWRGSTWSRIRSGGVAYMQLQDATPTLIFNAGYPWPNVPALGVHKIAGAFATNDMAISRSASLDGGITNVSSGTPFAPATSVALGGNGGGTEMLNGWLRSITYWPDRLSDAELQELVI